MGPDQVVQVDTEKDHTQGATSPSYLRLRNAPDYQQLGVSTAYNNRSSPAGGLGTSALDARPTLLRPPVLQCSRPLEPGALATDSTLDKACTISV